MNFEAYKDTNNVKELRNTIEAIVELMGPDYDFQTAMIAYHHPSDLEALCRETHDVSSARIDSLERAKADDLAVLTESEARGYVPNLENRRKIYEVYRLYSLFYDDFSQDNDQTVNEMHRRIVERIYDDEIADHQFFSNNAADTLDKRNRFARPLRWLTSIVFASALGISAYSAVSAIESGSNELRRDEQTALGFGMAAGSAAIGWNISKGLQNTAGFNRLSYAYARLRAVQKTKKSLSSIREKKKNHK